MNDESIDPQNLKHEPLSPARPGTWGEGIYLALWQKWIAQQPREWSSIFFNTNEAISQRTASVAATFIKYMGTNGGSSFTARAQRLAASGAFTWERDAFLAAWALENRRGRGVDHGLRTSEYLLASSHPIVTTGSEGMGIQCIDWTLVPDVKQYDYDVLECMVEWWSRRPAEEMRNIAKPLIEAAKRKEMSGRYPELYPLEKVPA